MAAGFAALLLLGTTALPNPASAATRLDGPDSPPGCPCQSPFLSQVEAKTGHPKTGQTLQGSNRPGSPFNGPVGGTALGTPNKVVVDPDAPAPPPNVDVKSYVVADLDTGEVLAAKNAHLQLPPASTLKTLTAVTLLPRLDLRARYRAVRSDVDIEGSRVGIEAGRVYTIDQIFYGLFLSSGNDAAMALAHAAGGIEKAVNLMNSEAARLGAYDTVAVNPHGLDARGQVSSAYDLALIAREGLTDPDFRRYVTTLTYDFPGRGGKTFQIQNGNDLLTEYKDAIGVKNGYTSKAHHTLIAAADRNGRRLIVTLMRTDYPSWTKAADLLDWGFEVAGKVEPVGRLVTPEDVAEAIAAQEAPKTQPERESSPSRSPEGSAASEAPTADTTPAADSQAAILPPALQRLPLWIWGALALFVVLASLRVYGYVRSRRRAEARVHVTGR
ncbi:MAG TPA: D-alanyl-D-alanine carboxypeptidase [Actinopolymorphaceae bacterium]|jgi:D-alanyl-D-alanine carboxypeptidase (penicillin-binding protein 5/6)